MSVTWWIAAQTAARHEPNNLVCVWETKGVSLEIASLQSGGAEEEELLNCCDCMTL